ncbi:phage tail sheath family protein [Sphingomonas sp.]|uniref:phage tail sheath family protein n=1 Tax=Sphingomonas sp. TaxID=28214 RepID=UPI0035BC0E64
MATTVSYPGVYIEEVPSGTRAITGVATAICAFVGRARQGPVNEPVFVNGLGDFDRVFGGLWLQSPMSFAVRDFFLNGGSQAVIVRLFSPDPQEAQDGKAGADAVAAAARGAVAGAVNAAAVVTAATTAADALPDGQKPAGSAVAQAATAAVPGADADAVADAAEAKASELIAAAVTTAKLTVQGLHLAASSPGAWSNSLRARIDHDVVGPEAASLFNLSIRDDATGATELFRNVSVDPNYPRRIDKVLAHGSALVVADGALPNARPQKSGDPAPGASSWLDATSSKVASADRGHDGDVLGSADFLTGGAAAKTGLYALDKTDLFNLLCLPPHALDDGHDVDGTLISAATAYCKARRAMLIVDPPSSWSNVSQAVSGIASGVGDASENAAIFFPRLLQPNLLRGGQVEAFAPCGAVAGVFARTDAARGVWKAPAGLDATLVGVPGLSVPMTDLENGRLNQLGVNCLRSLPAAGRVVWGARTRVGDDRLTSPWKYVPVRRTALFIEESLYRGTQWIVFEPNDASLWAQIRMNVGAFMQRLFRQGAFQGSSARDAYFVKCDGETTTQADIDLGIVNILVGFAPLKPAEFVIIRLQQMTVESEA